MPTTKPRHAITETQSIAHALAVAHQRWPDQPPTRLLTRLIELGAEVVERDQVADQADRHTAITALTELASYYPEGYLDDVRSGWDA